LRGPLGKPRLRGTYSQMARSGGNYSPKYSETREQVEREEMGLSGSNKTPLWRRAKLKSEGLEFMRGGLLRDELRKWEKKNQKQRRRKYNENNHDRSESHRRSSKLKRTGHVHHIKKEKRPGGK